MASKAEARLKRQEEKRAKKLTSSKKEGLIERVASKDIASAIKPDDPRARVSFVYADDSRHTWKDWTKEELCELLPFFQQIESRNWPEIMSTGGKSGEKVGLGYTKLQRSELPHDPPAKITHDVSSFFELRVCKRKRVFCFRSGIFCNFFWFDREHVL